ncbi:MAG: hypothetical protein GY906_22990 [bacterium]|nr:hypothetical protein [bacterium]
MTPQSIAREKVVHTIEQVLSDYVGVLVAHATSTGSIRRLGLVEDRLEVDQLELVLGSVETSLRVLAGDRDAAGAIAEVKKRLGLS